MSSPESVADVAQSLMPSWFTQWQPQDTSMKTGIHSFYPPSALLSVCLVCSEDYRCILFILVFSYITPNHTTLKRPRPIWYYFLPLCSAGEQL